MAITDLFAGLSHTNASITRGVVQGIDAQGLVLVSLDGDESVTACEVLYIGAAAEAPPKDSTVLVLRPDTSVDELPVVLGRVGTATRAAAATSSDAQPANPADTVRIEANKSIVLRAGEGSITVRADGKILIKGKEIVSHAQGTNRVKGGAVAIN